jgi:hypothetical protein
MAEEGPRQTVAGLGCRAVGPARAVGVQEAHSPGAGAECGHEGDNPGDQQLAVHHAPPARRLGIRRGRTMEA